MRNGLKTIRALLEQGVLPNPVAAEPVFNPGSKVEASASTIPMSPSEKRALLPAVEDLDNALKIVNNRVHYAIFEIAIHAIIVVALIVAIMTYGIGGAKNQLDTAMGFLENFYPGIGTILPGVIGLSAFKKYRLREDKRRQLLKLYDKRRRLLSDIKDRSLESIKSVETELSAILNM